MNLCSTNDQNGLKEHYIDLHKVDRDNQYFINLFRRQNNVFRTRRCLRCNEILLNHRFKVNHDFLVHYGAGRDGYGEKPVIFVRIGQIQKCEITFSEHSHYCDFYNSEKLVDEFLSHVRNKVSTASSSRRGGNFSIACVFSIENKFETFQTKSFNDFICFTLRKNILKRVISNRFTRSSWHFNCFLYINMNILDNSVQILR